MLSRRRFGADAMGRLGPLAPRTQTHLPAPASSEDLRKVPVEAYLEALGKIRAPRDVFRRVETAARFFERVFPQKSFSEIVDLLRGIDFSRDVKVVKLGQAVAAGRLLVQWQKPHPDDISPGETMVAGQPPRWLVGNFFSIWGSATETLGAARGLRRPQRYRVVNGAVDVLVSRTTAIVDGFTPGRVRHAQLRSLEGLIQHVGEMAAGGGLQIVIPSPVLLYLEPV